ncbi:hypothetical protein P4U97_21500 [Bacillus swezeyi]|uniref:hypothetical protein n=1 Tax=Bacillus swezeyi TaxID=1925020 RepID=UPI002E222FA1|nr:hypothetical protein [Bacillus swezeyi]
MKTDITFGDLVAVDGYPDRIFFVDAWQNVQRFEERTTEEFVEYDLTDAVHGECIVAYLEDIRLVCRKERVERFLDEVDYEIYPEPDGTAFHWTEFLPELPSVELASAFSEGLEKAGSEMAKEKSEKIDELLDELNDYKRLEAMYGDAEYKTKQDEIKAKLKREVERG